MKYFVILLVFVSFFGTAFAMPPFDSQEIFDFSDTIAVGKVVYVNSTFSPTHNLYHIQVEKFLKNPHDSEIIMAVGQNITSSRSGTQIFHVNDRALFFLTSNHVGYDRYSDILSIHPTTRSVEPEWDACDIFAKDIPPEHWVFGGVGSTPKIFQEGNPDIEDIKNNKLVTISYDVSNISNTTKVIDFDGVLSRSNGTAFETMSSMTQNVVLEPCTVYKTIEWRFTPGMTGSYLFEINSDSGGYGIGFTVEESVDSPLKQFKSGIPFDEIKCKENLILIQKYDGSPACVKPETKIKLVDRDWVEPLKDDVFQRTNNSSHQGPDNTNISVTGEDARAICTALKITCPSEPIFSHATLLENGNVFLSFSDQKSLFDIKLNQTHICVTSDKTKSIECSLR